MGSFPFWNARSPFWGSGVFASSPFEPTARRFSLPLGLASIREIIKAIFRKPKLRYNRTFVFLPFLF
jgi:hypothetical protein